MRHRRYEVSYRRISLNRPRTQTDQILAELSSMRQAIIAKAEAYRHEAESQVSRSIHHVVMGLSATGRLALALKAKHAV